MRTWDIGTFITGKLPPIRSLRLIAEDHPNENTWALRLDTDKARIGYIRFRPGDKEGMTEIQADFCAWTRLSLTARAWFEGEIARITGTGRTLLSLLERDGKLDVTSSIIFGLKDEMVEQVIADDEKAVAELRTLFVEGFECLFTDWGLAYHLADQYRKMH